MLFLISWRKWWHLLIDLVFNLMKNDYHLSSDSAVIFIKQESHSTPVELHFLFSTIFGRFFLSRMWVFPPWNSNPHTDILDSVRDSWHIKKGVLDFGLWLLATPSSPSKFRSVKKGPLLHLSLWKNQLQNRSIGRKKGIFTMSRNKKALDNNTDSLITIDGILFWT